MTFRETLREFLRRTREILDNNRAEGNISWIDDVMYFIDGKTRIRITDPYTEERKALARAKMNEINKQGG